jgi:hypothetical protein
MMQRERLSWPIPVGLIVAIAAGFLIYQSPLQSSRPGTTDSQHRRALAEQQVRARLWQDPLAAAEEHAHAESAQGKTFDFRVGRGTPTASEKVSERNDHHAVKVLTDDIARAIKKPPGHVTVLLVMVPGGPYVEGTESRLRTRYAVVSALGVACFVPEDSEHIGYVNWIPRPPVPTAIPYDKLIVPYEWYRPRKFQQCKETTEQPHNILIMWLNEDAFSDEPLQRLSWLRSDVKGQLNDATMTFKTIGPASSTTLRGMLEDAIDHPFPQHDAARMPLYSPWATANPGLLALSLQDKLRPVRNAKETRSYAELEQQFTTILNKAVDFRQQIGHDDELAMALLEELNRRGIAVGQDHIAWLAEWDSFYSRALQVEFSAAACVEAKRIRPPAKKVCPDIPTAMDAVVRNDRSPQWRGRSWLHHYSYLRGLDGDIPSNADGQDTFSQAEITKSKEADKDIQASLKELERPEGQAQLDYVHRLVARLEADAALWEGSGKELKAIGVLGSDVYDKLLILQAVRKRFPKAIFFTTDLDARLLHPSQYDWTRNLIIASHFGLQLHPALQYDIPSFRDGYQTSAFFSVLTALGYLTSTTPSSTRYPLGQYEFSRDVVPRIYEVGRTQAVDLSPDPINTVTASQCENAGRTQNQVKVSIHPPRQMFSLWHETGCPGLADSFHNLRYNHAMWAVIAVFLACVLLIPFDLSLAKAAFGGAFLLFVMLLVFWRLSLDPEGEPFLWLEGVSIWPTELLRMIAAGLSLIFVLKAVRMLRHNYELLTRRFSQHTEQNGQHAIETAASQARWGDWINPGAWGIYYSRHHTSLMSLWDEYRRLSEFPAQRRRVIPQVLLYGFFGLTLLFGVFTAPHIPFRGSVSAVADRLIVFLSVFSFLTLIFFVVDETRLCEQFIRRLTDLSCGNSRPEAETRLIRFSINLIAERTKIVGRLIDYPFIVLLILIVGRMRLFDNWDAPLGLVLLWGLSAGYAIVCAFLLGRAAEHLRQAAIKRLTITRDEAREAGKPDDVEQISRVMDAITEESGGAFAPWTEHPVFRAVLFPTSGFGLASLFEYFSFS